MMVGRKRGSLKQLTRAVTDAQRALAAARCDLADATTPDDPAFLVDGKARWAERILDAHRDRLAANPAVAGFGLGMHEGETVATVYATAVGGKIPKQLKLDKRTLPVHVISFGDCLDRHHDLRCGDSIGRTGPDTKGTLGCFARGPDGAPVAITAMHVMELSSLLPTQPPITVTHRSRRDDAQAPSIGVAREGTQYSVDAVRMDLVAGVIPDRTIPEIGSIAGWRPTVYPGDHGAVVRLYGAASGFRVGRITNPCITLPRYDLDDAIVVSVDTAHGDSGAAIVDNQRLLLGFLVGRGRDMPPDLRLFCPHG